MQRDNEDEAWRAIVENFGDRAALDPTPATDPAGDPAGEWDDTDPDGDWSSERFVPPPPPPVPSTTADRMLAWAGVFGSPTVLLVCLVLGLDLPSLLGYLLVASFVGGFLYLVIQMPRGPRDPDDDGAVL